MLIAINWWTDANFLQFTSFNSICLLANRLPVDDLTRSMIARVQQIENPPRNVPEKPDWSIFIYLRCYSIDYQRRAQFFFFFVLSFLFEVFDVCVKNSIYFYLIWNGKERRRRRRWWWWSWRKILLKHPAARQSHAHRLIGSSGIELLFFFYLFLVEMPSRAHTLTLATKLTYHAHRIPQWIKRCFQERARTHFYYNCYSIHYWLLFIYPLDLDQCEIFVWPVVPVAFRQNAHRLISSMIGLKHLA